MKKLNQNIRRRDFLLRLYFTSKEYDGGIRLFSKLPYEVLSQLVQEGFADQKERQNDSPSISEFLEFMLTYPEYEAHGYAVDQSRLDYRITIEGLIAKEPNAKAVKAFRKFCKNADELTDKRSWWD